MRAKPKAEMQWFKGTQKIKEGNKFAVKYIPCENDEYEIILEISVSTHLVFGVSRSLEFKIFRGLEV